MKLFGSAVQWLNWEMKMGSSGMKIGAQAQVFVSRLSSFTTKGELMNMFSKFGQVKEARLILDSQTRRPKGFAFVTFGSEDEACKAIRGLNGRIVAGRLIFVEHANTTQPTPDHNHVA